MHFKEKVIWITGASSGIGKALAGMLAQQKAKLILTARNLESLEKVQKQCAAFTTCNILPADLVSDDLEKLSNQALAIYKHIDIFINCAGVSQRSLSKDTDMKVYRQLMEINFFAPVHITKALLPHFEKNKTGHVIVLSSMAGLMGFPMRTGYSAAKHALKGFFETLQTEHSIPNFHITIVSPGRINTPISLSAVQGDGTPHNKMDDGQLNGIPVEQCATKILKAIEQNKKHIIIAKEERILWWFWKNFRFLYYSIARKKGLKD